jgi:hypothetical protein
MQQSFFPSGHSTQLGGAKTRDRMTRRSQAQIPPRYSKSHALATKRTRDSGA